MHFRRICCIIIECNKNDHIGDGFDMMRLDKLISTAANVSRQEARRLILSGAVSVDGRAVTQPEHKVDETRSAVTLSGSPLQYRRYRYFMLHKPAGVVTATEDRAQQTVLDLFPEELRRLNLVPAGRLDKDTTGLLLLTNDGDFVHRVISPRHHVPKVYLAETDGMPRPDAVAAFAAGLTLADGTRCLPALLEPLPEQGLCRVTVREGKYHQVKRMLAACGAPVLRLHRESIGALALDKSLKPGAFLELSEAEAQRVFLDNMPHN